MYYPAIGVGNRCVGLWKRPIMHQRREETPSRDLTDLRYIYRSIWRKTGEERRDYENNIRRQHRELLLDVMDSVSLPRAPREFDEQQQGKRKRHRCLQCGVAGSDEDISDSESSTTF